MKICDTGHCSIVYEGKYACPLCALRNHNDMVHDFIEQDPEMVKKLVAYMEKEEAKCQ